MSATDRTLNVRELARKLDVPVWWLKQEAEAGRIPFLDAGGRRLFNLEAVSLTLLVRAAADSKKDGS